MNKKEILKKEYQLFSEGYSTKEISVLLNKSEFRVKLDLFKLLTNRYQFKLIK